MRVTLCILVLLALIALVKTHAANPGEDALITPKEKEQRKKEKKDRLNNRKKNSKNKTNSNGGSQDKVKEDTSKDSRR